MNNHTFGAALFAGGVVYNLVVDIDVIMLYLNFGLENNLILSLFLFASVVAAVFDAEISASH